jgi:hypothetical protein
VIKLAVIILTAWFAATVVAAEIAGQLAGRVFV